jgi:membrane glycosyltransferase
MLLLAPRLAAGRDPASRMLARTIGIRDVVLGAGQAWASQQGDSARLAWMRAGTASDVADMTLSIASRRDIGLLKAIGAAGLAVPFVAAGAVHEVQSRH